jgi:hypothetical protein
MLFEAYVFVDWSAANNRGRRRPKADAVWVGWARGDEPEQARYHRTRAEGIAHVRALLGEALLGSGRVLVGFDFPYGYPRGLAAAAGWGTPAWRATWDELARRLLDGDDNHSNRFAVAMALNGLLAEGPGPFWMRPITNRMPRDAPEWQALRPTSPGFPFRARSGAVLERLRTCDRMLKGTQECWKLFGNGSVGSQALTGIPRVHALRFDEGLAAVSAVWPFETGFTATFPERTRVVHAEIWPGLVEHWVAQRTEPIRDERQVLAMCDWARSLDRRGELGTYFVRPPELAGADLRAALDEEGWVLGCR